MHPITARHPTVPTALKENSKSEDDKRNWPAEESSPVPKNLQVMGLPSQPLAADFNNNKLHLQLYELGGSFAEVDV